MNYHSLVTIVITRCKKKTIEKEDEEEERKRKKKIIAGLVEANLNLLVK